MQSEIENMTDPDTYLTKGRRVECEFFRSSDLGSFSLAGLQLKTTGTLNRVTGTIQRVSAEGTRERPVNIKIELLVESEQLSPEETSLIGTVLLLDPGSVTRFLP